MSMFTKTWSGLILTGLLFSTSALAIVAKPYTDAAKTITVSADKPEFTLVLPANPTTGYSWFVARYNARLIPEVKHQFQPATSQLVGAGGIDNWTFKVDPKAFTAPHIFKIKMIYARAWDVKDNSKETEFTVVTK